MPSITATRPILDERFPVLGFNVRTGTKPSWFEVALATDPHLFAPEAKSQRTAQNFYSSRAAGLFAAPQGEAVYLVPADVTAHFAGQQRLYFQLAVSSKPDASAAQPVSLPAGLIPSITISKSYTGRSRRLQIATRPGALTGRGDAYSDARPGSLIWAGDAVVAGNNVAVKNAATAPAAATALGAPHKANGKAHQAHDVPYSDGWDDEFWAQAQEGDDDDDDKYGIDAPIPDGDARLSSGTSLSQALEDPDYSGAVRFAPAKFFGKKDSRTIRRVVIHITDGGPKVEGVIAWFQNPKDKDGKDVKVSAHYVVGQDGTIVQMVKENDVAWHAGSANGDSIGIEHCANTRGLMPSEAEYCASAALVSSLCDKYGIDKKRILRGEWADGVTGIQGHRDADPKTGHQGCPDKAWDWDHYMDLVSKGVCEEAGSSGGTPGAGEALHLTSRRRKGTPTTRRTPAHPLEIVDPILPGDAQAALQYMKEFQDRKQAWSAGVADTSYFPFSAICQLQITMNDGGLQGGTGFYIAPDRILTVAHALYGAASVKIMPGRNNGYSAAPAFTVTSDKWTLHPSYSFANHDFDLAVIHVTAAPPGGPYFDILEELLECRDAPIMVCGYAGKTQNFNKQHVDGDTVRTVADNTLEYNLQTEPGTSGAPVYYLWTREDEERQQSVLETRVIGVHVDRSTTAPGTLNQACRLTADKIRWIQGAGQPVSTGSALGLNHGRKRRGHATAHALADPLAPGDLVTVGGKKYVIYASEIRSGGVPAWINNNPGNITKGGEAESYRAYAGKGNGMFAIFPDEATGFSAILSFLRKRQEKTIAQMMAIYAPPDDGSPGNKGNDPVAYANYIAKSLGVPVDTKVKDLSDDRLNTFGKAIQRLETGPADKAVGKIYSYNDPALPAEIRDRLPAPPAPPAQTPSDDDNGVCQDEDDNDSQTCVAPPAASSSDAGQSQGLALATRPIARNRMAKRHATSFGVQPMDMADVDRMKATFVSNASAPAKQNCITISNAGLRQLYGNRLQNADGSNKALGSTIQDTMAALQGYGLAQSAQVFEFEEASGRITKGVARPDHLHESVESWLLNQADANAMSGWYVFGLSLMDGYHSVVLALAFSGIGNAATKAYWADQIYSGWDDVTGGVDARITRLIERWWDGLPANKKARTRVTVWPLNP
jgi:V8-like Glu-specific endopeptidase